MLDYISFQVQLEWFRSYLDLDLSLLQVYFLLLILRLSGTSLYNMSLEGKVEKLNTQDEHSVLVKFIKEQHHVHFDQ